MRSVFLLGTCIAMVSGALADEIPKELVQTIKVYQISESTLADGILRVRYNKPVINREIFRTFIQASCTPVWLGGKKDGWDKARIERVEVVNQIGAQGFAFVGGRKACDGLGKISGGAVNEDAFIAKSSWVCVAGNPCRPRRDGEVTGGD